MKNKLWRWHWYFKRGDWFWRIRVLYLYFKMQDYEPRSIPKKVQKEIDFEDLRKTKNKP